MIESRISIPSHNENLATTLVRGSKDAPILLRISGGHLTGHTPNDWQALLAHHSLASLAFDFPGVGESTGDLNSTNLNLRLTHALNVFRYLKNQLDHTGPIFILGVSMGGPIAIHMMSSVDVSGLILCVSAAYPKDSWHENFGEDFSRSIRRADAWKDSSEFNLLQRVNCPIFFASAEQDQVIPRALTDMYRTILQSPLHTCEEYAAPHAFIRLDSEAPHEKTRFWNDVIRFMQTNTERQSGTI